MTQLANRLNAFVIAFPFIHTVLCLCAVASAGASEPAYNGKALSEWLILDHSGELLDKSAEQAIRQIGTNAIPTLLELLGATPSNRKSRVRKFESKGFESILLLSPQDAAEVLRGIGKRGFGILGTNAESAVPQLTKLLHNERTSFEAAKVLAGVGPRGFSVLTNAVHDWRLAGVTIHALGGFEGGDKIVITRLLISALKDPDPMLRGNAADFLRRGDAELAVPALIPMLDDNEFYPRERAAIALKAFGPAARSAAPKLLSVYTNLIVGPDRQLARMLGSSLLPALRATDPGAAREAEEFLLNQAPLGIAGDGWTTTRLSSGKELIAGGTFQSTVPSVTNHVFARAELFDPATGQRMKVGSMSTPREFHTATLLRTGKVLVAGGRNHGPDGWLHPLTSAELYDPKTGGWTETGSMNSPHPNAKAVLQSDGKVRVSGSEGDKTPPDDLYDPATGKWTTTPHI
jgi:hypothetical protein